MKKLILILISCVACLAADQRVTVTLTVTNNPVAHDSFTINAKTITWTNATAGAPSTLVLLGANIGAASTNLFRQLASYPLSGPVTLAFSSSNIITIKGAVNQTMAASLLTNWGTIALSTNGIGPMSALRVPALNEPTQSSATNIWSLGALDFGTYSTNAFAAGTTLVGNLVQTTGAQTIAGDKTFSDEVNLSGGGLIDGATLTNISAIYSGSSSIIELGGAVLVGGAAVLVSNTAPYFMWRQTDGGTDEKISLLQANGTTLLLSYLTDAGGGPVSVMRFTRAGTTASKWDLLTITNTITGDLSYTRTNHTGLANGNNAGVDFGGKVFVKLKAGPTAAFAICGIVGGSDGRRLIIHNSIAQNMTIANDSGVEPTAANRIYTGTGGDVATTAQGTVTLIYDSEDSRWLLVSVRD